MFSKTTSNIKVSVIPEYDTKNSYPSESRYVFKYNIIIENSGDYSIKILKKKMAYIRRRFRVYRSDG